MQGILNAEHFESNLLKFKTAVKNVHILAAVATWSKST